jgi:hypothetical protein
MTGRLEQEHSVLLETERIKEESREAVAKAQRLLGGFLLTELRERELMDQTAASDRHN